ncbi:glycosyltransferase [Micromonospora eburnea]|uniref:Glycosyltransferase involved in cell wall bisynthesis n=1 Tax=Micromonospora eburnea TaxID=227316 RepID=A0A1C6U3V7_9ACTN|nr:glycosyltransferase [Micromonospora eburnea]SCL48603.1 Glycosyltransferase involved in cell wall bisynthesis [Micromonospora eburnea]
MAPPARRPRLAVIVANGITGDSRVQKIAIAAAREGWDVTLIGAATGNVVKRTKMGPIDVIRVPVRNYLRQLPKGSRLRKMVTQFAIADKQDLARKKALHQAWVRQTTAQIGWLRGHSGQSGARKLLGMPPSRALGAVVRVRRAAHQLRVKAFGWEQGQGRKSGPTGNWRKDWPHLLDLDLAFGPVIERLKPDLIHANDITMINTAALTVARMRARGERVAWLYDAHEYVPGVDWPRPEMQSAFPAVEREFIHRSDAIVTVSPEIAARLQSDYRLPELPLVVRNTPIRESIGALDDPPSVRLACGLDADVPLLVYSGWLSAERGLRTAINSLPELPQFHLAIVSGRTSPELESLLDRADLLNVRDRIHVVPYVPQHAVPDYLSTADIGLICSKRTLNYELSLPTKLAEYLHAGLPVVASDVKTLGEYVSRHGVGEVFRSDDEESFVAAVTQAMTRRQELVANITEPVLTELSWEAQVDALMGLYRKLCPVKPVPPQPPVPWTVEEELVVPEANAGDRPLDAWRPLGKTSVRLGLGPANYAGQAAAFAKAICRENPDVSAEVVMRKGPNTFVFPADVYIDIARLRRFDVQMEQLQRVIGRYSHMIVDAFLPVFGHLNGDSIQADLPALRRAQIKVALLAHGSDIRHPGRHLERHEYSLFRDAPDGILDVLTVRAERNRRIADEAGLPLFVTTPDLLEDLPTATWAPLVVDVQAWASDHPVMQRPRPVVLHAPSARWTKGTDRILPVLNEMHDQGTIELKLAERLDWAELQELVKTADIVLDQFATGAYGTFAVEAMAAGRPVVAFLNEEMHLKFGARPPIVNATPGTLRKAIESLLDDRENAARIGAESVAYARDFHDGRRTASAFMPFLMS